MAKSDYEYSGRQSQCQFDESKVTAFKNTGMIQERYVSNAKLKTLVAKQPVSAGIVVTDAFRMYKSGIMTEEFLGCSGEDKKINHAVTVVGYGKTDRMTVQNSWCREYWIVQNSWGTQWGEKGFFRLCMDNTGKPSAPYGTCHINRFPSYPVA